MNRELRLILARAQELQEEGLSEREALDQAREEYEAYINV